MRWDGMSARRWPGTRRGAMVERLGSGDDIREVSLASSEGEKMAWLHARGKVIGQGSDGERITMQVRLSAVDWARFQAL